jgi:hypothetical protein
MTGAGAKLVTLVATPVSVVTVIGPMVALVGTWIMIDVSLQTEAAAASTPLNLTIRVPWGAAPKCVPVMFTTVPTPPPPGVKELIVGGGRTVNPALLVAVPPGVVTVMLPVLAAEGTVVLM